MLNIASVKGAEMNSSDLRKMLMPKGELKIYETYKARLRIGAHWSKH